jgi:SAM-dependent methyltransferase
VLSLDDERPPVPPADLMLRVVPSFDGKDVVAARQSFDAEGFNNLRLFENALAATPRYHFHDGAWLSDERVGVARSLADFERLLDFGCGCGRFLRHLRPLADRVELHGTDIDAEMIEWVRSHIEYGRYEVAPHEPPLPYEDHYFDLVLAHSVFTHLDARLQDLWLSELRRITRPEAVLLVTVEGQSTWGRIKESAEKPIADRWQEELERDGIVFIENDAWVGSTHPSFYHSTVHAPWYVFDHWAEFFDVEAHLVDGAWSQDLVVLRRRPDDAPPSRPRIRPRADVVRLPQEDMARPMARARGAVRRLRAHLGQEPVIGRADVETLTREIAMLREGLYEQGRRISVLAEQLRDEIKALDRPNRSLRA